jgi:thymidine phosphorylase
VGERSGIRVAAAISDMDSPIGRTVGNALEVDEAFRLLRNEDAEPRFRAFCLQLVGLALEVAGMVATIEEGKQQAEEALVSGRAEAKLSAWLLAQGADSSWVRRSGELLTARIRQPVLAPRDGYFLGVDAGVVGRVAVLLGAGRTRKEDTLDLAVGVESLVLAGDEVRAGLPMFLLHANDETLAKEATEALLEGVEFGESPAAVKPLLFEVLR